MCTEQFFGLKDNYISRFWKAAAEDAQFGETAAKEDETFRFPTNILTHSLCGSHLKLAQF